MALSLRARSSASRALLIARLHSGASAESAMRAMFFSSWSYKGINLPGLAHSVRNNRSSICRQGSVSLSGLTVEKRCFCSSNVSQNININVTHQAQQNPHQQLHQQPQPSNSGGPSQSTQHSTPISSAGPTPVTSTPPKTSAAAEVIDKYLGPSTLKLEKRDDRSPPPPPPPPRRNYGPQGAQEKKSGKDLVAESAACAVIEKYLGPWPGFPPRDPKIDEYLDSLPENAACAAIDKYFGPYKPLFVFKKNEQNANSPPPPSRPPRNRMVSRTRNRAWNASQQGGSVERPWTAPQQHAYPDARTTQGGQFSQNAQASPPQAAAGSTPSSQAGPGTVQPSQPNSAQYAAPNAGPVQGGQGSINGPGSSPQGTAAFSPSSQGTPSQSGTGMAPQQQHPPGPAVPQSYGSSPPAANIVPPQGTQV